MSLLHRLHGARCCPLRQQLRRHDGVRGVFSLIPLKRGDLILAVPLRYCYVTHAPAATRPSALQDSEASHVAAAHQLRRLNRGATLLPETWTWLQRYSCDAPADRVSLTSMVSAEAAASSSADTPVFSLTLSPVEAALATAVALRYFYRSALKLSAQTCIAQHIGPSPHELSDRFVESLPLELYMRYGLEALYSDGVATSAEAHLCLEQLAQNLRDAVLTYATAAEYRFLDENPSLLDNLLLVSLYVVRSRVLPVPCLGGAGPGLDCLCSVLAPLLSSLNHAPASPSAAAVVSPAQQALVVRAIRGVTCGEEITLDYRKTADARSSPSQGSPTGTQVLHVEEDWASRYLMGDAQSRG